MAGPGKHLKELGKVSRARRIAQWRYAAFLYGFISMVLLAGVGFLGSSFARHQTAMDRTTKVEHHGNHYLELTEDLALEARRFGRSGNPEHLERYHLYEQTRIVDEQALARLRPDGHDLLEGAISALSELLTTQAIALNLAARSYNVEMPEWLASAELSSEDRDATGSTARIRSIQLLTTPGYLLRREEFRDAVREYRDMVYQDAVTQSNRLKTRVQYAFGLLGFVSIVIPTVLLIELLRRRQAELQLANIISLGEALSASTTLIDSAMLILETADRLIGWDAATLDVVDEKTETLRPIASFDLVDDKRCRITRQEPLPFSAMSRRVISKGPQLILRKKGETVTRGTVFGNKARISASLLYVPLLNAGRTIGILSVHSYHHNRYAKRDLELLQWIADSFSGALHRATLDEALRRSEESSRLLLESSLDGMLLLSDTKIIYCNPALPKIFGYGSVSEVIGEKTIYDLLSPESYAEFEHAINTLNTDHPRIGPFVLIAAHSTGSQFHIEVAGIRIDYEGAPAVLLTMRDVSERERAHNEVVYVHDIYRRAIEAEGAVAYQLSYSALTYEFVGFGIAKLTGFEPEELTAETFASRVRDVHFSDNQKDLPRGERMRRMKSGELSFIHCDVLFEKKDGHQVWLSDTSVSRRGEDGSVIGSLGILTDITERKRNEIRAVAFASLGQELSGVTTAYDAARIVSETAERLFGWDACIICLYDSETDQMNGIFAQDTFDGVRRDVSALLRNGSPGERIRRIIAGKGEIILRSRGDASAEQLARFGNSGMPSASLLFAPIRERDRAIGYLSFQSYAYNAYTQSSLDDLLALANHCAAGLERAHLYASLRQSEEQFRTVWEHAAGGMRLTDAEGTVRMVNPSFCRLMGMAQEEIEGKTLDIVYASDLRNNIRAKHKTRFADGSVPPLLEQTVKLWDGRELTLEVSNTFITTSNGTMLLGVFYDRTQEKRLEIQLRDKAEELQRLAITDSLTGLLNRREFMRRANIEVFRAERYSAPLAFLMIDLDHFKLVNDSHNHMVGDIVLTRMGDIIREVSRVPDILGRYGGEEFCICAPETDIEGAKIFADRIRSKLQSEEFTGKAGAVFQVTCSIGIAVFGPSINDITMLLMKADEALYKAKENGRNTVYA